MFNQPQQQPQDQDPLDELLKPPENESPLERQARLQLEFKAKQISNDIDAQLKAERLARRKKRIVRLLLLGQSESGKSTTLRQFQRLYTPTAFREERALWRAVIQLNMVRSVRTILDALATGPLPPPVAESTTTILHHPRPIHPPPPPPGLSDYDFSSPSPLDDDDHLEFGSESPPLHSHSPRIPSPPRKSSNPVLEAIVHRLQPLRHLEQLLIAKLVPPNEEEAVSLEHTHWRTQEIFVRPGVSLKGAFARSRLFHSPLLDGKRPSSADDNLVDDAQRILHTHSVDMQALWNDRSVREVLKRRKVKIEEGPGFFLDDIQRMTSLQYSPTDSDVLRARLKTVGVSEYTFEMEAAAGRDAGTEWRIIDVGGARSQRQSWVPFFDNVDAIIFLAPISAFDQVLAEDRTVNRLEDSVLLWKAVCSNKLLANIEIILFLNKCDILDAKLKSGVRLAKYIKSYGDRDNDVDSVAKYLRGKFSAIHREYSPNPRKFYAFSTNVTDTTTTGGIIASVRDMVVRQHLKQSKLL